MAWLRASVKIELQCYKIIYLQKLRPLKNFPTLQAVALTIIETIDFIHHILLQDQPRNYTYVAAWKGGGKYVAWYLETKDSRNLEL